MKIALCLSGQYRTFDSDAVQNTLHYYLLDKYDCDVYASLWDNRGCSTNHGSPLTYKDENEIITEKHISDFITPHKIEFENFNNWYNNINQETKSIMYCSYLPNCTPLLYKRYKAVELIPEDKNYDFVILTRPDLIYLNELNIEDIIKNPNFTNTVWNNNPEGTFLYHPNRIYDILIMGHQDVIKMMSYAYLNMRLLLDDPFNSGLCPTNPCKMLHIFSRLCKLNIDSTKQVVAEVYRHEKCIEYLCRSMNISEEEFKKKHSL